MRTTNAFKIWLLCICLVISLFSNAQDEHSLGGDLDDYRSVEKVKLKLSPELHSKGKSYIKSLTASPITDRQIDEAELVAAGSIATSYYRIKLIKSDGTVAYSGAVAIR
jgi:hypothetical protein